MVQSPDDAQAWMRSVINGLRESGVTVAFADDADDTPGVLNAVVTLKSAWVSSVATSKTASVVLTLAYRGSGGFAKETDYRGRVSSVNWASSDSELQGLVNNSFARALSQVATDLHGLCAVTGKPAT
jgi:hypothetical protein